MKQCTANIICNDNDEILLLKRSPNDEFHPSTWCLPGGGLGKSEKPSAGVKRKTREEAGIIEDCYDILFIKTIELPDVKIHYFLAECKDGVDIDSFVFLDENEHCNYEWCDLYKWIDKDLILDLKDHLMDIFEINKIEKSIMTADKHLKSGIDKKGHRYTRIVNNDTTPVKKEKVAESSLKVPFWVKKFEGLKLNKMPVNIPEDKIHITYKEGDDPHFKSLMHWVDPKTKRRQDAYTKEFLQRNVEYKWQRIATVNHKIMDTIKLKCKSAIQSPDKDSKFKQSAAAIWIISETGLRPGNLELFKITGNRGVTTLAPDNVSVKDDVISFNFTGKSYKDNVASISNLTLANFIKELKEKNKDKKFLFDVDRHDVNDTFKDKFGFKGLKLKDMRTYIATSMAKDILTEATDEIFIKLINASKNKKLLINKKLKQVYEAVSQKLNNTPAMAKNSYIHPNVKKDWLALIGVNDDELMKGVIESDALNDLLSEASLDLIVKKYTPTADTISINEDEEEMCDYFPIEDWEEDENEVDIMKCIEDSLDINKGLILSSDFEKNRAIKEYDWYEKSNVLQKDLSEIPVSKITVKQLYKSLMIVLSKAVVDDKNIVDFESPLTVKMNKGEDMEMTTGKFCTWLYNKSNDKAYDDVGMVEAKKIIIKCNDNPFVHFMAKGITAMDVDFVENSEILSEEVYNLLKSGGLFDGSYGIWNTDIEKAMKDLSKYKKIHKLVYRDGKSFITTLYVSREGDTHDPHVEIELHPDSDVHKHAIAELSTGEHVFFMDKGDLKSGVVTSLKYHPVTDKFGTAVIKGDDGKPYTKSLKLVNTEKSSKDKIDEFVGKTAFKFPDRLADLTIGAKLGGSGDNYIATDKDGNKYSLKKARNKDGVNVNEQLKQSVLTDQLYAVMDIDVPESSYFQEGAVGYKISKFVDGRTLGACDYKSKATTELKKGFVMDCLVGNWDVIGTSEDNIIVNKDGTKAYRIDNDGSLQFRARGRKKSSDQFTGERIDEFATLLDESKNPFSAEVFKGITDAQIKEQGQKIVNNAAKLLDIINKSNITDKEAVKEAIIGRIAVIADKIKDGKDVKSIVIPKDEYDKAKYDSKVTADYFKDWDALKVEGNPEIKDGVKAQILKVEKVNQRDYEKYAKNRGITVEEYKKKLQAHIESLVSKSDFFRATDLKVLDTILNDTKRYKSQFETGTSHGCLSPSSRASTEHTYFGFKDSRIYDTEKRPIYGYFSNNKNGVLNDKGEIPPANRLSSYGEIIVKIKRESALRKATITFGDSLGSGSNRSCTFASKPHFTSFKVDYEDPLNIKETSTYTASYTEAQYHNQLKLEDIESIHFTPYSTLRDYGAESSTSNYEKLNQIIEITRKTHLPIRIFEHK